MLFNKRWVDKEIEEPSEYDIKDFEVEDGYENFAVLIFNLIL